VVATLRPDFFTLAARLSMNGTTNRRTRRPTSDLAKQTFKALEPYINRWCCGEWVEYFDKHGVLVKRPDYLITQEQWALFRRYQAGERNLTYDDGNPFQAQHVGMGCLSAKHVEQMIEGRSKVYQTGGRDGKAMPYLDYDDHHTFQTDSTEACRLLTAFLGERNLFRVQSARGINQHLKLNYDQTPWKAVNRAILDFGIAANRFVKAHGIWCDVETKGTISTTDDDYGMLAKLPCYGGWSSERLDEFKATPEQTIGWLRGATAALIEATDQDAADRQIALCEIKKLEEKEAEENEQRSTTAAYWERQREADRKERRARRKEQLIAQLRSMGIEYTPARPAAAVLIEGDERPAASVGSRRTRKRTSLLSSGSISSFPITDEQLALVPKMMKKYRSLSYYLFSVRKKLTYRPGRTIKAADFQYALTIMNLMAIIPNKWNDDQAATGRAKMFWDRLYNEGFFTRAWDSEKWRLLRETIVDAGFITLLDERYWFTPGEHSGKAMEWYLNADLQVQVADLEEKEEERGGEASMNVTFPVFVPDRWRPRWVPSPKWQLDTGQDPGSGFKIDEIELYQRFKRETVCA